MHVFLQLAEEDRPYLMHMNKLLESELNLAAESRRRTMPVAQALLDDALL